MKKPTLTLAGFVMLAMLSQIACAQDVIDTKTMDETRAVAGQLTTQLGAKLKAEMSANGPESAIGVCKQAAPEIAAKLSAEKSWQVGRVGTRVRNADLNTPNNWQQEALKQFSERLAKGEKPETMEFTQVENDGYDRYLRYAKAVMVQPVCVTCHGSAESMPDGVKARLKTEYPNDKASGYQVGELRGAIVIRRPF